MFCNIYKCHVLYPHSSLACTHVFCALFVLLCARISIYTCCTHAHAHARRELCVCVCVCVSASQINSVALEPKIYYQIKFLTEFIALSLAKHSSFAFRQHPTSNIHPTMSRRTLRTRHEPGENPTTPRLDPSNAEPLASPCRSGFVLRSPVNKWREFRFAFLSLFFYSPLRVAFFRVLFIKFIGNKFGQYARIIFACFVHLFAVDSAHSHTHTPTHPLTPPHTVWSS